MTATKQKPQTVVYKCQHNRVISISNTLVGPPDMAGCRCCPWVDPAALCVLTGTIENARWRKSGK